jgi:hypothetical protein
MTASERWWEGDGEGAATSAGIIAEEAAAAEGEMDVEVMGAAEDDGAEREAAAAADAAADDADDGAEGAADEVAVAADEDEGTEGAADEVAAAEEDAGDSIVMAPGAGEALSAYGAVDMSESWKKG